MAIDASNFRLETSSLHLLHTALQAADVAFYAVADLHDSSPRQFAVMVAVAGAPGAHQSEMARTAGMDRTTLSEVVRRLVKKGLLTRRRNRADTRAYAVKLTQAGEEFLKIAHPLVRVVDAQILAALPAEQRKIFVEILSTILRVLDRSSPQSGEKKE